MWSPAFWPSPGCLRTGRCSGRCACKTPYARFDRNDYSVPHTHVRRQLTLFADPKEIPILDGAVPVACHPRSYDAGAQIEDPAHIQALRDHKRRAGSASATDRLVHAVPASAELLVRAAQHGHALQTIVAGLGRLLQRYGAPELEAAILEVLKLEGPAPPSNSVLLALEKAARATQAAASGPNPPAQARAGQGPAGPPRPSRLL